jgi:hypothetical protein
MSWTAISVGQVCVFMCSGDAQAAAKVRLVTCSVLLLLLLLLPPPPFRAGAAAPVCPLQQ